MGKLDLSKFRENYLLNFAVLFAAIFVFVGKPVPFSNEHSYLLRLLATYDSTFFLNDPTFSGPQYEHWLFNHIFGVFTLFLSIEVVGWLGRIAFWSALVVLLIRLGRRWDIPLWYISAAIFLWLSFGQSVVSDEWIIGVFEAKVVAYAFLLKALDGICDDRDILSAACLGLTFSFHPIVGLWAILAALLAFLVAHRDIFRAARIAAVAGLFSIPGLVPLLIMKRNAGQATAENLQYLELVKFPFHFDPFSWATSSVALLVPLTGFSIAVHLYLKRNHPPRFLILFLIVLAAFFVAGFPLRFFGQFSLLQFMPMRLFPVFALLFSFFYLGKTYQCGLFRKPAILAVLLPMFILAFWTKLPMRVYDQARSTADAWSLTNDDTAEAFKWIRKNTEKDELIIAPPWRYDFWYLSRRSEIVNYYQPIYSDLGEWQTRLDRLTGHVNAEDGFREGSELRKFYFELSKQEVLAIAAEYDADYLISESDYPIPIIFSKGKVKVFRLK